MRMLASPSQRIAKFGQDVWSIFSPMAAGLRAVNLGQGFPNSPAPEFVKQAACDAVRGDVNQYSPPKGLPRLRQALATMYSPLLNRQLNVENEIVVTAGANEGMYAAFQAFLDPGDEVVVFEPFFDQYAPNITMSGGKLVYCPLLPPKSTTTTSASEWTVPMDILASKITDKTRMIILNTPHNPTGKVFSGDELSAIADLVKRYPRLIVISDEVYEHLVYGKEHVRFATLPGMWERTLTVGSAGKSFSVTGWRVGWLIGPPSLTQPSLIAHSRIVFCTNAPLQDAVANAFEQCAVNGFFEKQRTEFARKRDFLVQVFQDVGLPVSIPVDTRKLNVSDEELAKSEHVEAQYCINNVVPPRLRDWKICRWLTVEIGVAAIPPSEFYGEENRRLAEGYARFCFCKTDETLHEARTRLMKLKQYVS